MIPGGVILGVGFLDPEMRYVAVSMMIVTAAFNSACMSGFRLNHLDIAPRSASGVGAWGGGKGEGQTEEREEERDTERGRMTDRQANRVRQTNRRRERGGCSS